MSDLTSLIDLNDSDLEKMEGVFLFLKKREGTRQDLDSFQREVKERFFNVGFRVDVKVWETNQEGLKSFDIEIQERLEGEFDPDQMVWEVTNDILNLGDKGVISTKGLLKP